MRNRNILYTFTALFLLGLGFQSLTECQLVRHNSPNKNAELNLKYVDAKPYFSTEEAQNTRLKQSAKKTGFRIANMGGMETTEFDHANAEQAEGKKARGKGKENKKKKKKKKKKKVADTEDSIIIADNYPQYEIDEVEEKEENDFGDASPSGSSESQGGADTQTTEEIQTADEWRRKLFASPSQKQTTIFIQAYQSGKVSKELFYELTEEMYAENRMSFRELAVLAWGSTPSVKSFVLLSTASLSSDNSKTVQSAANSQLNQYETLNYVWVLNTVFRQYTDIDVVTTASKTLDESTKKNITNSEEASSSSRGRTGSSGSQNYRAYLQILPIAQTALQFFGDNKDIADPLQAAITRIQGIATAENFDDSGLEPVAVAP